MVHHVMSSYPLVIRVFDLLLGRAEESGRRGEYKYMLLRERTGIGYKYKYKYEFGERESGDRGSMGTHKHPPFAFLSFLSDF